MSLSPAISALIPNYNGRHLLQQNLPTVLNCLRSGDELIIVDDQSTDESVNWLVTEFQCQSQPSPLPETDLFVGEATIAQKNISVSILVNHTNQRFGISANRGVTLAAHDYIFLLNSDVSPHADAIAPLLQRFTAVGGDRVFGVGCLEITTHDQGALAGKQKLWFERGLFIHSKADDFQSGPTAWVTGGSGLFSKAKWLAIGGFDSRYYPAYWEDIDLSFQARKRGWQVLFEAAAKVDHNHETTNQTVFGQRTIDAISWKNACQFTWKNGTLGQKLAFLLWQPYWSWKRRSLLMPPPAASN